MKTSSRMRLAMVGWCLVTMVMPLQTRAADVGVVPGAVRDVALDGQGVLRGTLVTPEGKPQGQADVVLRKGNEVVAFTVTSPDGGFAMQPVAPGVYELATARSSNVYRVWTARTAPPAAKPAALLVESTNVVRGQEWSPVRRALILSGVIITSGVIGGVIGYNVKDDDSAS